MAQTTEERLAQIKADREARMAEAAKKRAESNPMFDPTNRPEAPAADGQYVYYYSWIGGVGTGSWKLYRTPVDSATAASATNRSTGGKTGATFNSSAGANTVKAGTSTGGNNIVGDNTGGTYKGSGTTNDPLTFNGVPFTGNYGGRQYSNGVLVTAGNNNNQGGANYSGDGTSNNPLTLNGSPYNGVLGGVNYINGIAQTKTTSLTSEDIETKARRTAQQDFKASLGELGLADLADEVDRMIKEDFTVSQIKMELPKSASYQLRFPGMKALRDAGRAISEATYISNEKGYLQTLRAYGLDTAVLGSRSELGKYIANEVSPREFEERVNMASTRVKENPDVIAAFKSFYPEADQSGVITYLLNPKAGMDVIKKQVRVSEIGAAATKAGFAQQIGAEFAGTLVGAVGETGYAQIVNEFQRARQLANSQRRLAQIEGQSYSDLEAVSAVVGDEVNAALASERRAARETARFGGRGGITGATLGTTAQI